MSLERSLATVADVQFSCTPFNKGGNAKLAPVLIPRTFTDPATRHCFFSLSEWGDDVQKGLF